MKQITTVLLVCLLLCAAMTACAKQAEVIPPPALVEPTAAPAEQMVSLPNPLHEVASYSDLLKAQPQTMLSDAPDGSSSVSYCYIDGTPVLSQIIFTYEGNEYTYRAAAVQQAAQTDISGVYDDLNKTKELTVEDNVTLGGKYSLRFAQGSTSGLATWYYLPTGCQYSLWTLTGCDVSQSIEEVVDLLLPIANDANGNPLEIVFSTPLPAIEEGKVKGTVAGLQPNLLTVQLENNNTLQFMLSNIKDPGVKVGDVVELTYSGNPLDAPEAMTITVVSSTPAATTVSGTVFRFTKQSVFVQTASANIFGFVIDANTAFKGQSTKLKLGNQVTVTYTGELSNAPAATMIETTAVSSDPEPTAAPVDPEPVNKSLKGLVTNLTTKRVTIYTDTGHSYTFQRDGATVVTGDYMLEYGARIRVLYDGYASNSPFAKRIDVIAPPDPTPPDPTPYVPTTYTITGTIAMSAGNGLAVDGDDGREYSFLLRSPSVSGDLIAGYRVRLTYQLESDGTMNATRIEATPPIVYESGPEYPLLMDAPMQ